MKTRIPLTRTYPCPRKGFLDIEGLPKYPLIYDLSCFIFSLYPVFYFCSTRPHCFYVLILSIKNRSKSILSKRWRRWVGNSHCGLGCLFVGQWKMMAYFTWATKDSWPTRRKSLSQDSRPTMLPSVWCQCFCCIGDFAWDLFLFCSIYSPSFCASFFCWKRMETPFKLFIVQMWKTRLASLSLQQWNKSRMRIAHSSKLHWRDSADPTGKGRKTFWGEKHPGWYHNNSRWAASIELETWRMWLHRQLNFFPFSFCFFHTSTHPNRSNPVQMPP